MDITNEAYKTDESGKDCNEKAQEEEGMMHTALERQSSLCSPQKSLGPEEP
jgi:hypothetical protein